ncbi:MAG: hypothetical protein KO217_04895 [Methanobacteriaceae archaeon]|jgi:hypothetical protein|nr:MAG: hypothetical protein CIT01_06065 [Methanobacterium sp. BRmetb2]MCC7558012.1 hypothetical protein [Methanobacteriaceae archaeon]
MGDIKEIKSVPVVSFALITGAVLAVITLIMGVIMTIFTASILAMIPADTANVAGFSGAFSAVFFIIVWPIMAFIGGFIMYAIVALVYNLLAPRIGGIKLELE